MLAGRRHVLCKAYRCSATVRSGDLLFASAQVGSHEDGSPEPDFGRQIRLAFDNPAAMLEPAGCTHDDIVGQGLRPSAMPADTMVDTTLVGFDLGQRVMLPSLRDEELWMAHHGARPALNGDASGDGTPDPR